MSLKIVNRTSDSTKHAYNASCVLYLVNSDRVISCSDEGKIKVWGPGLEPTAELSAPGGILSAAVSGTTLYTCTTDETIQQWELQTLKHLGPVQSTLIEPLKLFADQKTGLLWAGDSRGNIGKYENGKEVARFDLCEEVWDLFVTESPTLVYTARDRDVVVAQITSGTKPSAVVKCTLEGRSPLCVAGNSLFLLDRTGRSLLVHDNSTEKLFPKLKQAPLSELIVNAISAVSDESVFTAGYDASVRHWPSGAAVDLGSCVNSLAARSVSEVYAAAADGNIFRISL